MKKIITLLTASILNFVVVQAREIKQEFASERYEEENDFQTIEESWTLIGVDDPYNADQNTLDIKYFSKYNAQFKKHRFYMKLELNIELVQSGSKVYMLFGIQNPLDENYDYVRTEVDFTGDGDMETNQFTITDLYSKNLAKDGCLDQEIPPDQKQDWKMVVDSCRMTTILFARKKLTCAMYREFSTGDAKDVDYAKGGSKAVHAAYHVYFGAESVIKGWSDYSEFTIPRGGLTLVTSMSAILLAAALF